MSFRPIKSSMSVILLFVLLSTNGAVFAGQAAEQDLATQIDQILAKTYKPGEPGAAALVIKDGKVILRKGYGLADMELGVPVEPDMIFRLGSVTKQFTAVSILMLAEQGKLSLQDEITKFLPDYPTQGKTITVEHLLTHTSGIKSYTSMPEWLPLWRKDFSVKELVDLFKNQPMEFAPGERWNYNNSGYVLLGAIIEKASGLTYEDFLQKNIFGPLGMKHSYYGNITPVIPRRIPGYSKGKSGFENAAYLSMTQPYAAGSLISSVDDLAIWNDALFAEKLLPRKSLEKAFTTCKLKNGEDTRYGYGWFICNYEGHRIIEHGGGINGFSTYFLTIPEDHIFVSLLTNKDNENPEPPAFKAAAIALGKPYKEPAAIKMAAKMSDPLVGVYEDDENKDQYVTKDGEKLFFQRAGGEKTEIFAQAPTTFFFKDSFNRIEFLKDKKGLVTGMKVIGRIGPIQTLKRTTKPFPPEKKEIAIDPAIYDRYVGEYELAPGMTVSIIKEGTKLMIQPGGQEKAELFPEAETKFFVKAVEAEVEFVKDQNGTVTGLVLNQGGQKMNAKKIK